MRDAAAQAARPTASRTSSRWSRSTAPARWRTSRATSPASTAREQPDYLHPTLEPILKETYGVIIYQEQVMQIAQVLAGYSARRRRPAAPRHGQEDQGGDGRAARHVRRGRRRARRRRRRRPSTIFDQVAKFAGYGFNKSHAAAYALVAYQTAYLKANYPVEFLAALDDARPVGNTDKLNVFRQELDRLGIKLLPPDINRSQPKFSVEFPQGAERGAIRYALAAVKGVGVAAMEARGRRARARRAVQGPVRLRAAHRHEAGQQAPAREPGQGRRLRLRSSPTGPAPLPRSRRCCVSPPRPPTSAPATRATCSAAVPAPRLTLPNIPDWPLHEKLQNEFEAIGFYLSAHPLDAYAKALKRLGAIRSSELPGRLAAGPSRITGSWWPPIRRRRNAIPSARPASPVPRGSARRAPSSRPQATMPGS